MKQDDTNRATSGRRASHLKLTRPPGGGPCGKAPRSGRARIGVLSDTHGYLDPVVLDLFAGVDHIIHAGDVMDPGIISTLETVAPTTAVAGNLDAGEFAERLPSEASGEVAGVRFVVAHKPRRLLKHLSEGAPGGGAQGVRLDLVVWGHTHEPTSAWVDGALHLNPGTASSPDEDDDDPTVAIVELEPAGLSVRFIPLARRRPSRVAGDAPYWPETAEAQR